MSQNVAYITLAGAEITALTGVLQTIQTTLGYPAVSQCPSQRQTLIKIGDRFLKIFKSVVAFLMIGQLGGADLQEDKIREIGFSAFSARSQAITDEDKIKVFRESLKNLSDEQKIKAIAYRVIASDDTEEWRMRASNSMNAAYVLGQDPELIKDWSALKEMLKEQTDPRKFYLLSGLRPWTTEQDRHDFVPAMTHMLFEDGQVSKDEGEYTPFYANDVSKFAYISIVNNLRALGASFQPASQDLPHEKQALALALWLKDNWPGCEDVKVPRRLTGKIIKTNRPEKVQPNRLDTPDEKSLAPVDLDWKMGSAVNNRHAIHFVIIIILATAIGVLIRTKISNS